ncbi:ATP-binding protein [Patescibacteria group bacterium]|nr:ATP-binding protein [Patescibacteria group bacterium]
MSSDAASAIIWDKVIYISGGLVPATFLYFVYIFVKKQFPSVIYSLISVLVPFAFIATLLFSNLWIKDINFNFDKTTVTLGPIYIGWVIYFSVFMAYGCFLLWNKYRRATGLERTQLGYILLAMLFPIMGAFPFNIILPFWGIYSLIFIGPHFMTIMFAIIGYAIVRHRLFDIRFAFQQFIVYFILTIITFIICISGALSFYFFTGVTLKPGVFIVIGVCSVIIALIYSKLTELARSIAGKYFFQSIYDYQKTLREFSHSLTSYLEMPKLVDTIINTLIQTLKLHRVAVLVRDFSSNHYKIQKTVGFNEENGISMVRDNFLTSFLEQNPKIIVLEEVREMIEDALNVAEKERLQELYSHMEHIEAALIIPIINNGKMISLIVLGHKLSGDPYTVQDIDLLNAISFQASIALENARLYKEVNEFSQNLQVKIGEATVELQKKNENLKLLDKMKDQLIAVASHELRTPVSNAQNYLWMTLTRPDPQTIIATKDKERLQRALIGIQNLTKLINDILDVSKLEGGKMEVILEQTNYEGIMRTVVDELMPRAQKKGLSLTDAFAPNLSETVLADPIKLKEILINLVTNAIKYTDHGGIIVGATQKDQQIIFYIKDTGRGITTENIPKLFTKFYREDTSLSSSNPETGGTGLGLYITKLILGLMNGHIWVDSILGQGSTFYFSLPVATQAISPAKAVSKKAFKGIFTREDYLKMKRVDGQVMQLPSLVAPQPQDTNNKKKILLIEDEVEMRQFYSEFLSEKYDVDTAMDGADGLSKLRLKHYDLVLLDVMMPRMDGVGFMQGKQQNPEFAEIPVVLLTNLGEEETLSKCFDLGVKSMIMKSDVTPDQIIPVIEREFQQPTTPEFSTPNSYPEVIDNSQN